MSNSVDKKEFKDGLKATSLFGGVQIVNICIGIIRSKLLAILLGPEGMGLNGILNSTLQLINGASGFGLGTSAVKDVSESHSAHNSEKLSHTISILLKLVWVTGLLGFLICLIFSPILSKISFGSYDYILAFAAISISVLFMQQAEGHRVVLQGTRHFKYMAKASVLGSIIGLFTTIPLYYLWGTKGIVPAIIIASIVSLCLMWYFSNKVSYCRREITLKLAISEGRGMIKMGFFLSLQSLLALLMAYVIRVFINRCGGLSEVGLFVAGFAMIDTYVGMVFSAMGTEYYPRLSSHSKGDVATFNSTINQQIEISLIIISPIICAFVVFGNFAVTLLYSAKFLPITMMLCWAIMGTYLKAPSWCLAYSFLAKSDALCFFYNEVAASIFSTVLKIVFYYYWGLTGVGIAYFIGYFIYLLQVGLVCYHRYEYKFDYRLLKVFIIQFSLGLVCFLIFGFSQSELRYIIGGAFVLLSILISYRDLSLFIDVKAVLKKIGRR